MSFGFFSTKDKIDLACRPMNKILDGRTDVVPYEGTGRNVRQYAAKSQRGGSNKVQPVGGDDHNNQSLVADSLHALQKRVVVGDSRFVSDSRTISAHLCKVYMFRTLFSVAEVRAHYRTGQLLFMMKEYAARGQSFLTSDGCVSEAFFKDFDALFTSPDGTSLDINAMMDAPIDSVCLDLMMYETDEVFEMALGFIRRRYAQRRTLINVLPKLSVLDSNQVPVFGDFSKIESALKDLTYIVRSYQVWGVFNSSARPVDVETYKKCLGIFDKLDKFLFDDDSKNHFDPNVLPSSVTKNINHFHQRLLRNMGLVRSVLVFGLEIDVQLMDKVDPDFSGVQPSETSALFKQSKDMLFHVCKRIVFTLNAFIFECAENQAILFEYLDLLQEKMGVGLNVWDIVITLLAGNRNLCEVVPQSLFVKIGEIIQTFKVDAEREVVDSRLVRLLDFFYILIKPMEGEMRPIVRSQDLCTLVLFDPAVAGSLLLSLNLKERSSSCDHLVLSYHIKTVNLLALAAAEKNSTSTARIQAQISFEEAIEVVSFSQVDLGMVGWEMLQQAAFLDLLSTTYVDTALLERAMCGRKQTWVALEFVSNRVLGVFRKKTLKQDSVRPEDCAEPSPETADIAYATSALNFIAKFFKVSEGGEVPRTAAGATTNNALLSRRFASRRRYATSQVPFQKIAENSTARSYSSSRNSRKCTRSPDFTTRL